MPQSTSYSVVFFSTTLDDKSVVVTHQRKMRFSDSSIPSYSFQAQALYHFATYGFGDGCLIE